MSTTTRPSKGRPNRTRGSRRARDLRRQQQRPPWLLRITVAAVVVAAVAAVTVTLLASDTSTTTTAFDTASASADGAALAPLSDTGDDAAVGQRAPHVEGQDRDGETVTAPTSGRPTILLFLAHWCPHCRREVPAVQEWVDAGEMPAGVDVVAVSTAVDPSRPNHPPSAWLDREHWTLPTMADADGTAAAAYGVSAFPFWVAVDAQGTVVERRSGELTLDQVEDLAATASA
jgi:cytochrome c biogenesis protein CcmG/thiol:disulfide interchange protein DsbE